MEIEGLCLWSFMVAVLSFDILRKSRGTEVVSCLRKKLQ